MLAKCANPSCSRPFRYLHEGKLHRMELASDNSESGPKSEWFWLCSHCSSRMTLRVDGGKVVAVRQMQIKGEPSASNGGKEEIEQDSKKLIKSHENKGRAGISISDRVAGDLGRLEGE
jgi:hypothetical protein